MSILNSYGLVRDMLNFKWGMFGFSFEIAFDLLIATFLGHAPQVTSSTLYMGLVLLVSMDTAQKALSCAYKQ